MLDFPSTMLGSSGTVVVLLFLGIAVAMLRYEKRRSNLRVAHIAGPSGFPIFGNMYDLKSDVAEQYRKWSKVYGDVFQIQLGDIPILVVNTASAAKVIFLGHSNALSSRPIWFTFHQIIAKTNGTTMGTAPNSKTLNQSRKGAPLGKPAVQTYVQFLDVETKEFLRQCLDANQRPLDPLRMLQRMSLSLDLTLCWGRPISLNDPLLAEIAEVEHGLVNLRNTLNVWQDCVPMLRFPWSSVTRRALSLRQRRDNYFALLNKQLDEARKNGTDMPCIRSELLDRSDVSEEELTMVCLTFVSAGIAPTVATLQWSIALLADRPDIQRAAIQALRDHYKVDTVLGDEEDDLGCHYIVALVKECLRFYTAARNSLPRSTVKEFSYNGKLIPAGVTVFLNAWACNMDTATWSNPEIFDPTRWLENPNAPLFTFGLGSRGCSGISLANRLLYLFFVRLISAFEIEKGSDVDVHPVRGCKNYTDLVSYPKRYTVVFNPRNEVRLREALNKVF